MPDDGKLLAGWLVVPMLLAPTVLAARQAATVGEIRRCSEIASDEVRLQCFDGLAAGMADDAAGPLSFGSGAWELSEDTDALTDARRAIGVLVAEQGRSELGRPVSLIVRCNGGDLEVYVNWQDYLGREARVTSRIGDGEPGTRRWSMSTDNTSTFYPRDTEELLNRLRHAPRWVVQVTPYNASPITAVFVLDGTEELIEFMRPTCELPLP